MCAYLKYLIVNTGTAIMLYFNMIYFYVWDVYFLLLQLNILPRMQAKGHKLLHPPSAVVRTAGPLEIPAILVAYTAK